MIKAVFSDLDGTLLNENGTVSEETKQMIEKLKKAGIKFFIATGRSFLAMKRYYDHLNLDTEIINYNGAVIHDSDGKKIFELTLDDSIARELIDYGRKNNLYYHGFSNEKWYLENYDDTAKAYGAKSQLQENIVNFDNMPKLDFNKMMFINDAETTKIVDSYVVEKYKNRIYKGLSSPTFLEIMNPDVSKGNSVKILLEKYGFHPDEVIAFGDAENDLEMLFSVKYGVAMENANNDVKSKVNYIAKKNTENGVALFLEDFLKL